MTRLVIKAALAAIVVCTLGFFSTPLRAQRALGANPPAPIFVDKVWRVEEGSSIEPGMLEVFLSDGTLLFTSPHGTPLIGSWRTEGDGLAITEEGITYHADILESTESAFRIRIHNPGGTTDVRFARESAPVGCTTCAPTAQHAVTGTVTYRERRALPSDAVVDVWITDVSPLIMIQSIVAEASIPTNGRQVPIPFELTYDPSRIVADHTYAIKAVILDRGEVLFSTPTGVPVITKNNPTRVDLVLTSAVNSP